MTEGNGEVRKPSLADEYIEDVLTQEVELPSMRGKNKRKWKLRRGSTLDFIFGGSIPTPLLSTAVKAQQGSVNMTDLTPEEMKRLMMAIDYIASSLVFDPVLVPPAFGDDGSVHKPRLNPGQLGTWQVLDSDKFWLYQIALADAGLGPDTEAKFRSVSEEHPGNREPVPSGEGVRPAPERPAGSEVGTPDESGGTVST